jgi:hypothetical protein
MPGVSFSNLNLSRPLEPGDCVRFLDGSPHLIQYVNSSGAYAVPLRSLTREIKAHDGDGGTNVHVVGFQAGGRAISVDSAVELIDPRTLGVDSHEYARYVKMSRKVEGMAKRKGIKLGEFDQSDYVDPAAGLDGSDVSDGHSLDVVSATPDSEEVPVAKKAKAGNGAVKGKARAEKPPKTVRQCACGCGGQTSGHFVPGHDSRLHGWIRKLADGRMDPKELPAKVRSALELTPTKNGYKAGNPHFYRGE